MITVTARTFQQKTGEWADRAMREPVTITKHGRESLVLLSHDEYARLAKRDRKTYTAVELPEELRQAMLNAKPPAEAEAFNDELDD